MKCPNCHDTRIIDHEDVHVCLSCGFSWTDDGKNNRYDDLDRLIDLHCRYEMLVGR